MSKKNAGARTRVAMAGGRSMAKSGDFKETVAARVQNDPAFAQACFFRLMAPAAACSTRAKLTR